MNSHWAESRPKFTPLVDCDAVVLCGGQGTRLHSVLPNRQKVTAEVRGKPFIWHVIRWLADAGLKRVVLAAGHRHQDLETMQHAPELPTAVSIAIEASPMGTGGAARSALTWTKSNPVLVLNGDVLTSIDLASFYAFHCAAAAKVSLALVTVDNRSRYGVVETDPSGAIASFDEKKSVGTSQGKISAGIYFFERSFLESLPENTPVSLERDVFPKLVGDGLHGMHFNAKFIDIGTPESLRSAQDF